MKNIIVVAFDCDGVMFDTTKANIAYYNSILEHFNRPAMTPEQFAFCHMHTVDQSISHLFNDKEDYQAAQAYRKKMSYFPFLKYMEMEPYLKTLLEKLRPKYKTAVATNRSDTMGGVLAAHGLTNDFDLVVSSSDVKRPKPYPDPLNKVLDHFRIKPYQSIYVGDSELDQIAASLANIPFVAYKNRSLEANYHIESLQEIEEIIEL